MEEGAHRAPSSPTENARTRRPARLLALAGCLVALAAALPAATFGAGPTFVKARVASGQTVRDLRNQWFVQKVTCTRGCDVTTIVSIALSDARRLGFKGGNAGKPWVEVASSYVRLRPKVTTNVPFVLTRQGRALLPQAHSGLRIVGRLTAIATANLRVHSSASWGTVLK